MVGVRDSKMSPLPGLGYEMPSEQLESLGLKAGEGSEWETSNVGKPSRAKLQTWVRPLRKLVGRKRV